MKIMSKTNQNSRSKNLPISVGITGGIGSGKTTACKLFEQLGIPVYYADERAKALMVNDKALVKKIKLLFGEEAYLPDGNLNRKHIAGLVFQHSELLEKLNKIVHPAVLKDGEKWHRQKKGMPYTLKESAILFEIGSQDFYDKIVVVYAPKSIRLERAMLRDGLTKEAVEARMSKQMDDEEKRLMADFVLVNDGRQDLEQQVVALHEQLLGMAALRGHAK
jgi:dephospho-CoA kinase